MMFGDRVFKEMYDIMTEMERELNAIRKEYTQDYKMPVMDMYETEDELVVIMELPGVKKEDIVLNVTPSTLEVTAELKEEKEDNRKYHKKERIIRKYYRSITLPTKVSVDNVDAKYENGMLIVRFKKEAGEKKRVEIH
ncbi:Hsp20/alpha crystallin family protein [Candidatus Aciduliprofundum boonei]|uniref:Heat shock protein Hsp20 n=1 Tax=Aciduliprofundum boonei (strain DSM 19572 / T469) TaxID=439481 RepID=B5IAD9_ACIB4|nr:Hsp20/alpha crystallin family protein [Candidatus Aciduliprofundum boonei]ADD08217.1 heat shock protein Hsp20 [Aciduliprofundum boonei T469]EDY35099.1 Hsp20/alpha crystallin family [Aciduliprofundum boonei T469]EDY36958.1 Hsp20/alpha crystallin family [Aciduliprofundum boonei T469]HII55769.1 Hsp20/alpha crystallin family protein [Candidatus Aciduliprofundum boonei]